MKKILSYIFIGLVLVGVLTPMARVSAQSVGATYDPAKDPAVCVSNLVKAMESGKDPSQYNAADDLAAAQNQCGTKQGGSTDDGSTCGINPVSWFTVCILGLLAHIAFLVLSLVSLLLWLAGTILDYVLKYTIIDMAAHINGGVGTADGVTYTALTGINIAWKVFRDLMNIGIIFWLVYEGIRMILGIAKGGYQKIIVGVITAALLVNFSLFFTKVMIDASNLVTIGIYNSIVVAGSPVTTNIPGTSAPLVGISAPFMKALGVSSFWSSSTFTSVVTSKGGTSSDNTNLIIIGLAGSILFLVVAFVFLAVAAMFVIRYVALVLLLMTSPIAYMGFLPFMEKYTKEWWESLKGQLLFAPIYMLMTWVILTLVTSDGFIPTAALNGSSDWGKLFVGGSTSSIGLLFNFVIIIALVIASLTTSKKYATMGADAIGSATKWLTGAMGGAVMGSVAGIGRNTAGRFGNAVSQNEKLKDTAVNGNFVTRNLAKFTLKSGDKAATSTFDVRGSKVAGTITKDYLKTDFGKVDPKKQNFRAKLDEISKGEETTAKLLKPSDIAVEKATAALAGAEFTTEKEAERKREFIAKGRIQVASSRQSYNTEVNKLKTTDPAAYALIVERDNPTTIPARKAEIEKQLQNQLKFDVSFRDRMKNVTEAEQLVNAKQKEIEEVEKLGEAWLSEEKRKLIAIKGGQEEKKAKGGKILNVKVDSLNTERVQSYADRIQNESYMVNYLKNHFRVTPITQSDNAYIARKIRASAKIKPPKDQFEDILKKAKLLPEEDEGEEGTPPAASPATPSPASPTP